MVLVAKNGLSANDPIADLRCGDAQAKRFGTAFNLNHKISPLKCTHLAKCLSEISSEDCKE